MSVISRIYLIVPVIYFVTLTAKLLSCVLGQKFTTVKLTYPLPT